MTPRRRALPPCVPGAAPIRGRRGAEAVEFALIMPIFIMVLIGIFETSWIFYHESALDTAANVGCRAGSLEDPGMGESDMATVETTTKDALIKAMGENGISDCESKCTAKVEAVGTRPGRSLVCEVTYAFDPILGIYYDPVTMESRQVVRMEWQRG